jgi:hypothetical protein
MIKSSIISVITILLVGRVYACIDERDMYSAGVLFNNNETMDITKIETIGKPNVNYFKNCDIAQPVTSAKPIVVLTPEIKVDMHTDAIKVESLSVQGNTLIMTMSYSGGCKTHEINMYASSGMGKSIPPVLFLTLSHNANNDMCEALPRETLNFDLTNLSSIIAGYSSARLSIQVPNGDGTYVTKYAEWYLQNTCSVKYRSHNAPEMLVTLEYVPHQITKELFPSLRLTSDPSIQTLVKIDYTKAVVGELMWLTEIGIIKNLNSDKIKLVTEKLKNSGSWYWTKQDSAISYNGVFTYKRDDSGVYHWDDVVYMDSRKNGCGSYTDFALPSESLSTSFVRMVSGGRYTPDALSVKVDKMGISIQRDASAGRTADLRMVHLSGRVLFRKQVMFSENGTAMLSTGGLHSGVYNLILDELDTRLVHTVIIP